MEVLIILILAIASLLGEESDKAHDSQAGNSEADSVVPEEASILLDSRGSRVRGSLEEDCTVSVSLVRRILELVEVKLVLILTNHRALRVGLILLTEIFVTVSLVALSHILNVFILIPVVSLVVSGLVVLIFVHPSELLSEIKSNLSLQGLKFIALELGPQVKGDLRLQLGIVITVFLDALTAVDLCG